MPFIFFKRLGTCPSVGTVCPNGPYAEGATCNAYPSASVACGSTCPTATTFTCHSGNWTDVNGNIVDPSNYSATCSAPPDSVCNPPPPDAGGQCGCQATNENPSLCAYENCTTKTGCICWNNGASGSQNVGCIGQLPQKDSNGNAYVCDASHTNQPGVTFTADWAFKNGGGQAGTYSPADPSSSAIFYCGQATVGNTIIYQWQYKGQQYNNLDVGICKPTNSQ